MNKKKIYRGLYEFIVVLRVVFPILIFRFPLVGLVGAFFLDAIDGEFASHKILTQLRYEIADKFLDFWWYAISFVYVALNLKDYLFLAIVLLAFRIIGDAFFLIRKDRKFLLYFPNFYENMFVLIFLGSLYPGLHFLLEGNTFYVSLAFVFLLKIAQEFWLHALNGSFTDKFMHLKKKWSNRKEYI